MTSCACPRCNSTRSLPLFWGYPGDIALAASRQGLIVLGGCMIDDAHFNLQCADCGQRWEAADAPPFDWSLVAPAPPPKAGLSKLWDRLKFWWAPG